MSALSDEMIEPYVDSDGLVHMKRVDPVTLAATDQNGVTYTSMWYILMCLHNSLEPYQVEHFGAIMRARFVRWPSGLINRGGTSRDQEGQDDYLWLSSAGAILGTPWIANNILWYGEKGKRTPLRWWLRVRYFYNNVREGTPLNEKGATNWSAWLGRYPAFVPHLYFANKKKPSLHRRIRWALALVYSSWKPITDSDTWTQSWAMVQVFKRSGVKSWVCAKAVSFWWTALKEKAVPFGMAQVAFPEHPYHPITMGWENFE